MNQITTKYGDKGYTKLHGEPFIKSHEIFQTVGAMDECMAAISVALNYTDKALERELLIGIIHDIYEISAIITGYDFGLTREFYEVKKFEEVIASVPPLIGFTLGYLTPYSAALNFARTMARRAERQLVKYLVMTENLNDTDTRKILEYFNRLSDLLFSLAELNK